ncbi:sugar transferase [Priestia megaterium]|uniref:sugar transferase n=1 Tax=Priestia megaterium TaxID=1404 RepID=UPI00119FD72F|nr:sugar transferase [Priestia megaterium]
MKNGLVKSNPLSTEKKLTASTIYKNRTYFLIKKIVDLLGGVLGLLLTLPIFLIISLIYLFGENKGPIFFKQLRIGANGKEFYMYKFRSMIVNAEKVLKEDKLLYQKYLKNNYKLEQDEDPRITKVGQFLRKTSLDELPQLINVIKGDMSIIGPRPVIKDELQEYSLRLNDFLSVKPGVTGYWQICGRSNVGYPERAELEFYYVDNQGILLDNKIFFKTILMVILRKGAY